MIANLSWTGTYKQVKIRKAGQWVYNPSASFRLMMLPFAFSWSNKPAEISSENWKILQSLYKDPADIDLFVGGIGTCWYWPLTFGVVGAWQDTCPSTNVYVKQFIERGVAPPNYLVLCKDSQCLRWYMTLFCVILCFDCSSFCKR